MYYKTKLYWTLILNIGFKNVSRSLFKRISRDKWWDSYFQFVIKCKSYPRNPSLTNKQASRGRDVIRYLYYFEYRIKFTHFLFFHKRFYFYYTIYKCNKDTYFIGKQRKAFGNIRLVVFWDVKDIFWRDVCISSICLSVCLSYVQYPTFILSNETADSYSVSKTLL